MSACTEAPTDVLVRVGADGALDTRFGTGGVVELPQGLGPLAGVRGDAILLALGPTTWRYRADGTLDPSYGTRVASRWRCRKASAAAAPSSTTAAGFSSVGSATPRRRCTSTPAGSSGNHLFRYREDGLIDPTFRIGGTGLVELISHGHAAGFSPVCLPAIDGHDRIVWPSGDLIRIRP